MFMSKPFTAARHRSSPLRSRDAVHQPMMRSRLALVSLLLQMRRGLIVGLHSDLGPLKMHGRMHMLLKVAEPLLPRRRHDCGPRHCFPALGEDLAEAPPVVAPYEEKGHIDKDDERCEKPRAAKSAEEDRNPFSNFILICKSKNINKLEAAKERNK